MSENDIAKIARLVAFPGSPDDMMNTIAALRARVAKLEAALKLATDFLEDVQDGLRLNGWGKELAELFVALKDAPQ